MAVTPVQSTTGDPIFRAQSTSVAAVKRFTRIAADATQRLNAQERIVSPGDDALAFSTSRRIRAEIGAIRAVSETGQLNVSGLGVAVEGLDSIKVQLDKVKRLLVQSQVADESERDGIQAEIDLALSQIDSTAHNTKLGSRSLLDGGSTIKAYHSINTLTGCITDFSVRAQGFSVGQTSGVQNVRVNKLGTGGSTRRLNNGHTVLSFNISMVASMKATRAFLCLTPGGGAGEFAEFRITGKLGSALLRLPSDFGTTFAENVAIVDTFNKLATETGVVLTSGGGTLGLTTVGYGSDEFIKVELISASPVSTAGFGAVTGSSALGTTVSEYGVGGTVKINGVDTQLGGEYGTTARYLTNGFDIEIDFNTPGLTDSGNPFALHKVNLDLGQGVTGLLGPSGRNGDIITYGFGNFTAAELGRGPALNTVTTYSLAIANQTAANTSLGNAVLGDTSVADLGSGGRVSLKSGKFSDAFMTIDRAIGQVIKEQARLGTIQGNFIDAINRAEVMVGNLTSADADIIGVDAATEITNLVQAQLGTSTATALISQANNLQATIYGLLRG